MAVKTYQHAGGRLVSEKTTGGSRKDYLTDALGSVTAVTDTSGNTLDTVRNAAYGKRVSGAAPTVTRTWVGTWGYTQTGLLWADVSLPYRHYSSQTTRWTTRDPLWPRQQSYAYVMARPSRYIDPAGLQVFVFEASPVWIRPSILPEGWSRYTNPGLRGGGSAWRGGGTIDPIPGLESQPWGDSEDIIRENEQRRCAKCTEIHDWYKENCSTRSKPLSACNDGDEDSVLRDKSTRWCKCAAGRKRFIDVCGSNFPPNQLQHLVDEHVKALRNCLKCQQLLTGIGPVPGPDYGEPPNVEPPFPLYEMA